MAENDLELLIAEIGKAFKSALQATEEFSLQSYLENFDTTPDPSGGPPQVVPKTVPIPLPQPDGTYKVRDIPRAALLRHSSLQIEDLRIKLRVSVRRDAETHRMMADLKPSTPTSEEKQDASDMAEIEITFKRDDPPEGVGRLSDNFNKSI